jgi:hypothetical protein
MHDADRLRDQPPQVHVLVDSTMPVTRVGTTGVSDLGAVSSVMAALVRAWISGVGTKFDRFADILTHGYSTKGEAIIVWFHDYIRRRRR